MPIYNYRCAECGLPFETRRSVEQRDDVECPHCELPVQRVFIPTAQVLTPAHFRMTRGWHLPDTKEGYRQLEENQARLVTERQESPREFVEQRLAQERRIRLSGG